MSEEIKKGLLGIVVDETTISHVVPELSALTYREVIQFKNFVINVISRKLHILFLMVSFQIKAS